MPSINSVDAMGLFRECKKCGETQPTSEFQQYKRRGGIECRTTCKTCDSEYYKSETYLAKVKIKNARYRADGRFRERERLRAKKRRGIHDDKASAREAVNRAVSSGQLIRAKFCSECGAPDQSFRDGRSGIQAHHDNYAMPLIVRWLCHACHVDLHRTRAQPAREDGAGK